MHPPQVGEKSASTRGFEVSVLNSFLSASKVSTKTVTCGAAPLDDFPFWQQAQPLPNKHANKMGIVMTDNSRAVSGLPSFG